MTTKIFFICNQEGLSRSLTPSRPRARSVARRARLSPQTQRRHGRGTRSRPAAAGPHGARDCHLTSRTPRLPDAQGDPRRQASPPHTHHCVSHSRQAARRSALAESLSLRILGRKSEASGQAGEHVATNQVRSEPEQTGPASNLSFPPAFFFLFHQGLV